MVSQIKMHIISSHLILSWHFPLVCILLCTDGKQAAILPHPQRVFTFVAGKGFGEIPCFAVLTQSPNTSKRIHVISLVRATVWTECAVDIKSVVKLTSLKNAS